MKTTTVLSEKNRYEGKQRIFSSQTEIRCTRADDLEDLARYYGSIAKLSATLEWLEDELQNSGENRYNYMAEMERIKGDIEKLEAAVALQREYLVGYAGEGE